MTLAPWEVELIRSELAQLTREGSAALVAEIAAKYPKQERIHEMACEIGVRTQLGINVSERLLRLLDNAEKRAAESEPVSVTDGTPFPLAKFCGRCGLQHSRFASRDVCPEGESTHG